MTDIRNQPLNAKPCYGHLGGILGNRLFTRMVELGWMERNGDLGPYSLTELGISEFTKLGVDIYEKRK